MLIPNSTLPIGKQGILYDAEADVINLALFDVTADDWEESNPALAKR